MLHRSSKFVSTASSTTWSKHHRQTLPALNMGGNRAPFTPGSRQRVKRKKILASSRIVVPKDSIFYQGGGGSQDSLLASSLSSRQSTSDLHAIPPPLINRHFNCVIQPPRRKRRRKPKPKPGPPKAEKLTIRIRRGSIALTKSQHDLFGRKLGGFTGPQDAYAKYLGQAKVFRIKSSFELTIGRVGSSSWRKPSARAKIRNFIKGEKTAEMMQKWSVLEDLRARIITVLRSLQSFQRRIQELEEENRALAVEKGWNSHLALGRVSTILRHTDSKNSQISRNQKKDMKALNVTKKEYAQFKYGLAKQLQEAQDRVDKARQKLSDIQVDIVSIKLYDEKVDKGLTMIEITTLKEKIEQIKRIHAVNLSRFMERSDRVFAEDNESAERGKFDVVEKARVSLPEKSNETLSTAVLTKNRLRKEIRLQSEEKVRLDAEIRRLIEANAGMRSNLATKLDRRRLVLKGRLQALLNCAPDSDIKSLPLIFKSSSAAAIMQEPLK